VGIAGHAVDFFLVFLKFRPIFLLKPVMVVLKGKMYLKSWILNSNGPPIPIPPQHLSAPSPNSPSQRELFSTRAIRSSRTIALARISPCPVV